MLKSSSQMYQYTRVEDHVLDLLEAGTLQPGDKLPSLRKMSARMKVSVPTVAQAYAELESRGVVASRERSGFFVNAEYRSLPKPTLCPEAKPEQMDLSRPGLLRAMMDACYRKRHAMLGSGVPDEMLMAGNCLGKVLRQVVADNPVQSVMRETPQGNRELRKQIALCCMDAGAVVSPDDIVITTGALEGIGSLLQCITRPGDAVLIQAPVFIVYLKLLEQLGLRPIELPSCPSNGVPLKRLQAAIRDFNIRACLFIPNFHLDGSLTSDESKQQIVELLAERDIPLIEDDVFGELYFGETRPSLCKSFDKSGCVATVSSFSKTIAPGYRVGWMLPGQYKEQVLDLRTTMNVTPSTPAQMALAEFMRSGGYDTHMNRLRKAMELFMAKLQCSIGRMFPEGSAAARPKGGSYMWIKLPDGVDSKELFFRAQERNVLVAPGSILSFSETFKSYIRINCPGVWTEEIYEAVETLGALVTEMCD